MRYLEPEASPAKRTWRQKYEVYLASGHWRALRRARLAIAGYKCEACGSDGNGKSLHVHHLRYGDFYDVRVDELRALCEPCHALEHEQPKWTPAMKAAGKKARRQAKLARRKIRREAKQAAKTEPPLTETEYYRRLTRLRKRLIRKHNPQAKASLELEIQKLMKRQPGTRQINLVAIMNHDAEPAGNSFLMELAGEINALENAKAAGNGPPPLPAYTKRPRKGPKRFMTPGRAKPYGYSYT